MMSMTSCDKPKSEPKIEEAKNHDRPTANDNCGMWKTTTMSKKTPKMQMLTWNGAQATENNSRLQLNATFVKVFRAKRLTNGRVETKREAWCKREMSQNEKNASANARGLPEAK